MTLIHLALKNLLRKRVRSIAIICAAALASGLIFSSTAILQSTKSSLQTGMNRLGADILVVPAEYEARGHRALLAGEPTSFYMNKKNLETVKSVTGVGQAAPQLFMASAVLECCVAPNVLLVGYDPASDFTIKPWIRFSTQAPKRLEKLDSVIIGSKLKYLTQNDMRFYGKPFWIGGVLDSTGLGFLDSAVFMTMDVARDMINNSKTRAKRPLDIGPDMISSVLVKVDSGHSIRTVAADIEKALPGVIAIRTQDLVTSTRRNVETALWGVMAAGIAFWVTMLILMGLVFAMTVNERGRELGIMRAMGATRMHVFRLILSEAAILTGTGAATGIGLAWIIIANFKQLIIISLGNLHFLWPSYLFIISLGLCCLLLMLISGMISALYPAIKSTRGEPYAAIHQGA